MTKEIDAPPKQQKGIQSVETGYKLLMAFSNTTGAMTLKELALAAQMPSTKAYFYLTSFMRVGLVVRVEPGARYKLGPSAIKLGLSALSQLDPLEKAREAIAEIRGHATQSAFISVMGNHGPNVVYRMQGDHLSAYEVRLGAILPRMSATGRALMASLLPEQMLDSVNRATTNHALSTPYRKLTKKEALDLCRQVHEHGVTFGGNFVAPDFASIAAPIYDHVGNVACAITLVGYKGDVSLEYDGEDARRVLTLARRLSGEMGWRDKS